MNELYENAKGELFNTQMVIALLEGRKKQTRRIMKPQPWIYNEGSEFECLHEKGFFDTGGNNWACTQCGCGIDMSGYSCFKAKNPLGSIIYVRETWGYYSETVPNTMYRADYPIGATGYWHEPEQINWCDFPRWRPSIHMPKEAARIFLQIEDVKIERLQDITLADIKAEGLSIPENFESELSGEEYLWFEWQRLWDSTIKPSEKRKYGWNANPWVWKYVFKDISKSIYETMNKNTSK